MRERLPNITEAINDAENLLRGHFAKERGVEDHIISLLRCLDTEPELEYHTPSPDAIGSADIFVRAYNLVIEVKAVGKASPDTLSTNRNETQAEQLERYLRQEVVYQQGMLPFDRIDRPWMGVLADGRNWYVWVFDTRTYRLDKLVWESHSPQPRELVRRINHLLGTQPLNKPPVPNDSKDLEDLFRRDRESLEDIYNGLTAKHERETRTKRDLWLDILKASNMAPESDQATHKLFVAHSFLVVLAKCVVEELRDSTAKRYVKDFLGEGFIAWIVADIGGGQKGRDWADALLTKVRDYDWRKTKGDVLRPLYEKFVDAQDRKDFGEFYTSDWIAELIVDEVLDDDWCKSAISKALAARGHLRNCGVLDPTCGSGTFLYHAAKRILNSQAMENEHLRPGEKSNIVAMLINGIDIHPVAVEMARASVLRALPEAPTSGIEAIQIFQGDSLVANEAVLAREEHYTIDSPRFDYIEFPKAFVHRTDFTVMLRSMVEAANSVKKQLPNNVVRKTPNDQIESVQIAFESLKRIIANEGNSVWAWYISNVTGPLRLVNRRVDRIVANPPWLRISDIGLHSQNEGRKKRTRRVVLDSMYTNLGIRTPGKIGNASDIAALFIFQCRKLYMAAPDSNPAAWLVQSSALAAMHWSAFRDKHDPRLKQSVDFESTRPFGDSRSGCVLFEHMVPKKVIPERYWGRKRIEARLSGSKYPDVHASKEQALSLMNFEPTTEKFPKEYSDYAVRNGRSEFKMGAQVKPYVLTLVNTLTPRPDATVKVTTIKSVKGQWKYVSQQSGVFHETWIRPLVRSKDLLPFALSPNVCNAIIPVTTFGTLHPNPSSESDSWKRLDAIWKDNRSAGRSTPEKLVDRINNNGTLSKQLALSGKHQTLVLQPKSGAQMRAARWNPGSGIINDTIYFYEAASEDEAAYLVGLLNAPALESAFKECRTSNRDFTTNPWRCLPIRRFDATNPYHGRIAELTKEAETVAQKWLCELDNIQGVGQRKLSNEIRRQISDRGLFTQIDHIVKEILPLHCS